MLLLWNNKYFNKITHILLTLMFLACQPQQKTTTIESIKDTSLQAVADTTQAIVEEYTQAQPSNEKKQPNDKFDKFIYDFVTSDYYSDKEHTFQKKHTKFPIVHDKFGSIDTIQVKEWKLQKLYLGGEPHFAEGGGWLLVKNPASKTNNPNNEKILSSVQYATKTVKNYHFQYLDSLWVVVKISEQKIQQDTTQEDFSTFLHEFFTKPAYQKQRIKFPLSHIYRDLEELEGDTLPTHYGKINKKEWIFDNFYYSKSYYYIHHNLVEQNSFKKKTITFHADGSCGNGILTFELIDKQWWLVELEGFD